MFYFFWRMKKQIAQKYAVLQQDLKFKKMRKNEGGGLDLKIKPPPTFLKNT